MAGYTHVFSDKETTNWFKACIALNITKEGLTSLVDTELQKVHQALGASCGNCSIENILKCPTKDICRNARNCNFHKTPAKQHRPCPLMVCHQVQQKIIKLHRYQGPSWRNTHAEYWVHNHWEIAKCFLPPDGYTSVSSVHETDFNGFINVMINCNNFDRCLSFSIAAQPPACLLTKARKIGRAVRHTTNCKVTDAELQDHFQTLTTLLGDPQCLAQDPAAISACTKLNDLQNGRISITQEELGKLLQDAQQTLVNVTKAGKKLSKKEECVLEEINRKLNDGLQRIDTKANEVIEQINQQSELARDEITTHKRQCLQDIDKHKGNINTYKCKIAKKARLIEEKARAVNQKVQDMEQTAKTIAEHAHKLEEHERAIDAKEQKIETKTHDPITCMERTTMDTGSTNYERDVEEMRSRVIQHYKDTLNHAALSPLNLSNDTHTLQEIYAVPDIYRLERNDLKLETNTTKANEIKKEQSNQGRKAQIHTYKDVFGSLDKLNQRIFLQGDAGTGKSAFTAKLVLDWCKGFQSTSNHDDENPFGDSGTLKTFNFVFLVTLRDSIGEHEVPTIIKDQIINRIYSELDREKAYQLLQRIFEKEICLVVQDGLDEWTDIKEKHALPLMLACHRRCTVLTTSRPYKMADERITRSQIDSLIILEGVKDPFKLCKVVLQCLIGENFKVRFTEFQTYVQSNGLCELLSKPMLLALVVCLFVEGVTLKGSLCEIYSMLLDSLVKKVSNKMGYFQQPPVRCFENTQYVQPNIANIDALSTLAFRMLFAFEKEISLVFDDRHLMQYVSEEQKSFALKCGILSERKCSSILRKSSTFSFIHKSVQEFLAAYHFARNEHAINEVMKYLTHFPDDVQDMSQVFRFLCGLNIQAANNMSSLLDKPHIQWVRRNFQENVMEGYCEARNNGVGEDLIQLKLSYFSYIDSDKSGNNFQILNSILKANRSNVRSLHIEKVVNDSLNGRLYVPVQDMQGLLTLSADCLEHFQISFHSAELPKEELVVVVDQPFELVERDLEEGDVFARTLVYAFIPQPNMLAELNALKKFELNSRTTTINKAYNIDSVFPSSSTCLTCFEDIRLPSTLERIDLLCVKVSRRWLRHLLIKLSTFDHHIDCYMWNCCLTKIPSHAKNKDTHSECEHAISDSCANNLSVHLSGASANLYEPLYGLQIHTLELYNIEDERAFTRLLPTLKHVERLKCFFDKYFKIPLPRSVSILAFTYLRFSPCNLRDLLDSLSSLDHTLKCELGFTFCNKSQQKDYNAIKQELEEMKFEGIVLNSFLFCNEENVDFSQRYGYFCIVHIEMICNGCI